MMKPAFIEESFEDAGFWERILTGYMGKGV